MEEGQLLVDAGAQFERWSRSRNRPCDPMAARITGMLPPWAWRERPESSLVSKFAHICANKSKQPLHAVTWTPEGRRILTGSMTGEFTLWNGTSFGFEMLMQAHENAVRALAWSHRGDWLISGDVDGNIKVWQPNFNNVNIVRAHREVVRGIAWNPSDTKFVTGSDDSTVKIWSFASMQEESTLQGHGWDVNCTDWHPALGLVVSGSKDNTVKLWDPRVGGGLVTTLTQKNTLWKTKFQPSGGQQLLATAGRDQSVQVYDLRNLNSPRIFRGEPTEMIALAWHPVHPQLLAAAGQDGSVSQYLLDDSGQKPALTIPRAHHAPIWDMAWHPAGHMLATGSNDRTLRLWTRPVPGDDESISFDPRFFEVTDQQGDALLDGQGASIAAAEQARYVQSLREKERKRLETTDIPGLS